MRKVLIALALFLASSTALAGPFFIVANQGNSVRRQVYFHLVAADGITPAAAEAGGQPQISINGGAWTNTGIGPLVAIGYGRYYAVLTLASVSKVGDEIETRFLSGTTAECPGPSIRVVAFNMDKAASNIGGAIGMNKSTNSFKTVVSHMLSKHILPKYKRARRLPLQSRR